MAIGFYIMMVKHATFYFSMNQTNEKCILPEDWDLGIFDEIEKKTHFGFVCHGNGAHCWPKIFVNESPASESATG